MVVDYNETALIGGRFREKFQSGCFGDLSRNSDIMVNVQHDRGRAVGRSSENGGLVLTDGHEKLEAALSLPSTQEGNDVAKLIKRGILAGWSVEFEVRTESEVNQVRVIEMANLISQFYLSFYRRPPGLFGVIGLGPRAGARQTASENMDMKWRFWESEKRNEQDGYTEGLIRAQLERAKSGNKPKPDQLGSVETAVSLWSRCFASADVTVDGGMGFKALTTLSPSVLALIGRGLAGRGEAIFSVQVQAGKIMLSPASSWTLRGG